MQIRTEDRARFSGIVSFGWPGGLFLHLLFEFLGLALQFAGLPGQRFFLSGPPGLIFLWPIAHSSPRSAQPFGQLEIREKEQADKIKRDKDDARSRLSKVTEDQLVQTIAEHSARAGSVEVKGHLLQKSGSRKIGLNGHFIVDRLVHVQIQCADEAAK